MSSVPEVKFTYGGKSRRANALQSRSTNEQFMSAVATSPPSPQNPKKRPIADEEHGGIENEGAARLQRSASVPALPAHVRKIKKPNGVCDLLTRGVPTEHIETLVKQIKAAEGRRSAHSNVFSMCDDADRPDEYILWLRSLGFDEEIFGLSIKYTLQMDKFKHLRAALEKTDCWQERSRARSEVPYPGVHPGFLPAAEAAPRRPIPRINTSREMMAGSPEEGTVAATPSKDLTDGFEFLSLSTPRVGAQSADVHSIMRSCSSTALSTSEPPPPADAAPSRQLRDSRRPSSERFPPSIVPQEADMDPHDAEVHLYLITNSESCGSAPGAGSDVGSSRSSSRPASCALSPPSHDRHSICRSADPFAVNNPHSAFKADPDTAAAATRKRAAAKARKLGARGRSISAPVEPTFAPAPGSPTNLACTQPTAPVHTPIVFRYLDSEPAPTHILRRFKIEDTEVSSAKKASSRLSGIMPAMPAMPTPYAAAEHDEEMVVTSCLDRGSMGSFPPLHAAYAGNRNALTRRMSLPMPDNSPLATMHVIHEGRDESVDEPGGAPDLPHFTSTKKKRLSNSKKLRMSRQSRRRSSIFSVKKSTRTRTAVSNPHASGGHLPVYLTVGNFYPVVVGGLYQQTFEFNRPVVYECGSAFPRVQAIEMPKLTSSPSGLQASIGRLRRWYLSTVRSQSFSVYEPEGDEIAITIACASSSSEMSAMARPEPICLGSQWAVVPAYPGGLLIVSTGHFCENDKRRVCFFVPDHFLRIELMCDVEESDSMSDEARGMERDSFAMGLAMDLNASQCTESTEADEMDCMRLHSALETSVLSEAGSRASDGHDMYCSQNHLAQMLGDDGSLDSPAVSWGGGGFSPAANNRANRQILGHSAGDSITSGLTKEGDVYFRELLRNVNAQHDLKNSGDVMEHVLRFLDPKMGQRKDSKPAGSATLRGFAAVQAVSRRWAVNWVRYSCSRWSPEKWDLRSSEDMSGLYTKWKSFVDQYDSGTSFGVGGAKTVFRVQPRGAGRLIQRASSAAEAVAVMDVQSVMEHAVEQELVVSVACSALVKRGICPNIVQVKSTFQTPFPAPSTWMRESTTYPGRQSSMDAGHYQYINMEFCAGGDVEGYIRKLPRKSVPVSEIRNMLFQMCFAIYSCRDQLSLRHFDIKLLNFLIADSSALVSNKHGSPRYDRVMYRVGFGENVYALPLALHSSSPGVIKLADFGTSLIGEDSMRSSITAQQFTTIENTAPEFLFQGSAASSASFAADTFGLGLSFLHLVTGRAPYEELLEHVRCPPALQSALEDVWTRTADDSPYLVIQEVLSSLDAPMDDDDSCSDDPSVLTVLYDTLYRYVVMIGLPNPDLFSTGDGAATKNPVVSAILDTLDQGLNENAEPDVQAASMQYMADAEAWSIFEGKQPVMRSARTRLKEISPDAQQWLRRMLCYDPLHRCLMMEIIRSPMFDPLLEGSDATSSTRPGRGASISAPFMFYWRSPESGGDRDLPML